MKNLVFVFIALFALQITAQEKKEISHEQRLNERADRHIKELTIALDLNEKQQKQFKTLYLEEINNRKYKNNSQDKVSMAKNNESTTHRIARQEVLTAKIKEILNAEQFSKWEDMSVKQKMKSKNVQQKQSMRMIEQK